jgi:hypothetical protein
MGALLLLRRVKRRVRAVAGRDRAADPERATAKTEKAMRRAQAKAVRLEHKRRPGPPGGG